MIRGFLTRRFSSHPDFSIPAAVSPHLDALRSLATLAVFVCHLRNLFFEDLIRIPNPSNLTKAAYFLTGFGHQSVVVFFVLSGLLVSIGVYRAHEQQSWSWRSYLIQRCSRLLIVLWPALALTFLLDWAGSALFGYREIYGGDSLGGNVLRISILEKSSPLDYLSNAFFLNGTFAPTAGSNGVLWSLSQEFWYYLLLPLLVLLVRTAKPRARLLIAIATGIAWSFFVPGPDFHFSIWAMGAGVSLLWAYGGKSKKGPRWLTPLSFVALLACLTASRIRPAPGNETGWYSLIFDNVEVLIALSFSVWIYLLLGSARGKQAAGSLYTKVSREVSDFSYTIYLTHLPVMVFFRAWLVREARWQGTASNLLVATAVGLSTLVFCYLFSRITEAHTFKLRNWLQLTIPGKAQGQLAQPLPMRKAS